MLMSPWQAPGLSKDYCHFCSFAARTAALLMLLSQPVFATDVRASDNKSAHASATVSASTNGSDLLDDSRQLAAAAAEYQAMRPTPPLPREQWLRRSPISAVQLSPDGRYLCFRKRQAQQTDLLLQEREIGKPIRVLADIQQLDVVWAGDSKRLWLADTEGLAVFDVATGQARRILKWADKRRQQLWLVDHHAPDYAVISEKVAQNDRWVFRYLRVDSRGQTTLLLETAKPLRNALLNADGTLAFSSGYEDEQYDTVIRRYTGVTSQDLLHCVGIEQCRLVGYNPTKQTLWLLSHHNENTLAMQRWQAADGGWQTVHRGPGQRADATSVLWQANTDDWLGIAYHPDHQRWYGKTARLSAQLAALQQQVPEASLQLTSAADGQHWLVQARHASWALDRYFIYTPDQNQLQPLFRAELANTTAIDPAIASAAIPVSYRGNDGMLLHGYVYLPHGVALKNAPLIALLHGGPYNRDRDDFQPITQLLVNRGYIVFSPNFRASIGYGMNYVLSSQGDFGNGKVLADILTGMDFLLAQGIGDAAKQAVAGHSFGGYASLLAAHHAPARFQFAVAAAAPVDFSWGMQWIAANGGSALPEDGPPAEIFFRHYGVPLQDPSWQQRMRQESPLATIAQLKTPLYLWAGGVDDRVPLKGLYRYASEVKRHGSAVQLLVDPDSGHNPQTELGFEVIVYLLEAAAAEHFAGVLTPPSAALQDFLNKNTKLNTMDKRR
ncbi:S9 family peptidase [Permianibacter sp. IMCC34836]|uniref:S9 family peptidase n=1 Tax=Permianibacter fluminis TaxID=2738515 RepID=UPI001557BE23|nr:alpha/beta fold hydrolase [Permianibacter fluminis]NQD36818.1 S9 family peptidase [Permianibacter fluminis]